MSQKPHTTFHLVSLFPESFSSYINESIIGRAVSDHHIDIKTYNPRDFTEDKNRRIDRIPYGGGPGMVIEALPVAKAIDNARGRKKTKIILLSPSGIQFTNEHAEILSKEKHIIIVSGRYEGIDARIKDIFPHEEYSIGPYTLTGGELPALVMLDAITRRIPGVLGNKLSLEEGRIASKDAYTRPEKLVYKKKTYTVPNVLLSGNHKEIDAWRTQNKKTQE